MKTFRDYKDLIYKTVSEINAEDPNYSWSVHSFGKDRVQISWEYAGKGNYFAINRFEEAENISFITSRDTFDEMINGHIAQEQDGNQKFYSDSYETAIRHAIHECAINAHHCY